MASLPKINFNEIDQNDIIKMAKCGGAFIKVPDRIYSQLVKINQISEAFFAQEKVKKKIDLFSHELKPEGFLDQSESGNNIERYINRGNQVSDPVMSDASEAILEVRRYYEEQLSPTLITILLNHLNISDMVFKAKLGKPDVTLSIIHYPSSPIDEIRIKPHYDGVLLTILCAPQPGLEVFIDGKWEKIICEPGYVIAQIGDGLKFWSDENIEPLQHRVIVPRETTRISIASFFGLNHALPFNNLLTGNKISESFGEYISNHIKQTYSKDELG